MRELVLRKNHAKTLAVSKVQSHSAIDAVSRPTPNGEPTQRNDEEAMLARIVSHCMEFKGAELSRSVRQLALNFSLFAAAIIAMYASFYAGAFWLTALLAIPTGGLLVRLFIIQHDCGHGSYFKSKRANHIVGWAISLLTVTPYGFWRDAHNRHHASSGNLAKRGMGAVDTLTVDEFQRLTSMNRKFYKFYRHPLTLFIFGPPFYFMVLQRFPISGAMPYTEVYHGMKGRRIWQSVLLLNIGLVLFYGLIGSLLGFGATAAVFLPVISVAAIAGSWLFFVQHQYENSYWAEQSEWDYNKAAIFGSSHYKLPAVFQWFTGNIGLHHIHHLCSLIPNYKLQECYNASADLKKLPEMNFADSLKCSKLALWDRAQRKLISFREAKAIAA